MSNKLCPHCGASNSIQAKFCSQCGKTLSTPQAMPAGTCPRCHTPLRQSARFCPSCGYNLVQAQGPIPPTPTPPGGGSAQTQLLQEAEKEATLIVRWMGGVTQNYPLDKPAISIGRAPGNDIVINHPAVSSQHLRLSISSHGIEITDLNSTNGTMVNGQRIAPNKAHGLRVGDVVRIGDLTGNWVSLALEGEGLAERSLALGKLDLSKLTTAVIGRDPHCYLPLNHPTVSFRHAVIQKQNGGLVIRDLGSTNGTFVNGQRISQAPLKSGDVIQIGPFKLSYDAKEQAISPSMRLGHRLDCIRLGWDAPKKKGILDDITLSVNPGEFIALVGGSGAGKSTLMKAMNGYRQANHGYMLLDGEPLYSKLDLYRNQMGYVPQDDIIHRILPVRKALWYAAKLRLPDARPAEIEARIQDALRAVDMVDHQHKPVRVLSGGQRKRVSIAVELLARPTLFYLDEPTSGLDPGLEKKMMYDLAKLADEGRTIVLVTHATANIEQCDHVAFLTRGKLSYYGPPNEALSFYNVRDFSDIYIKLSQEIDPAQGKEPPPELAPYYNPKMGRVEAGVLWAEHYKRSSIFKQYVADRQQQLRSKERKGTAPRVPPKRGRDSFIRQMFLLTRRQFDLIRLDWRTLFILLAMMPLIGLLFMSVSTEQSFTGRPGSVEQIEEALKEELEGSPVDSEAKHTPTADAQTLVTMLGLALTQAGTFSAAYEIVKERAIFQRERAINLSVIAYVLSKVIILAIFAIFQVISVLFILGLKVDLDFPGAIFTGSGVFELFVTLYLGIVASIMFGLFISAIVPNADVVLYAILIQLFVQIVLSGTLFPLESTTASKGVVGYWVMDAMGSTVDLAELNDKSVICKVTEVEIPAMPGQEATKEIQTVCDSASADLYLDFQHTEEHILAMWIGLSIHIFIWCLLTIIIQARKKID